MKKIVLLCAFLLVLTSLFSQYRKIRFGMSFNPQLTIQSAKGKFTNPQKLPVGFNYGLDIEWNFKDNYSLATGLFHTVTKTNVEFAIPESLQDNTYYDSVSVLQHKYAFQLIELPITMKLKTNQLGYFTYFGQIGLNNFIKIAERPKEMNLNFNGSNGGVEEKTKNLAPFNVGIVVGGGAEYAISQSTSLQFGLLYKNALINHIRAKDYKENWGDDKFVNHMLVLKMGVLF